MGQSIEQASLFATVQKPSQKLPKNLQQDALRYLQQKLPANLSQGEQLPLCGVPLGMTALPLVALYLRYKRPLLFIAADDRAMREAQDALQFFGHNLEAICYPAWDCQPYDRVSPSREGVATRLAFLARLNEDATPPPLMLTTVAAMLQRVVPKNFLHEFPPMTIKQGGKLDRQKFAEFALRNGYHREDVVRRAGEYAVRGGLIDVFPADEKAPVRIDCDSDLVDSIKTFDPLNQRSAEAREKVRLLPASEAPMSTSSWKEFRARYRQRFGVAFAARDPLFAQAEQQQGLSGFEHLLPLFFDSMATLGDHIPRDSLIVFGQETREACRLRRETIDDHFEARQLLQQQEEKAARDNSQKNQPREAKEIHKRAVLPPDALYLSQDEWQQFAQEFTKESTKESIKEPAKESIKEPAKESTKEPAKESTKEPAFSYVRLHRAPTLAPVASAPDGASRARAHHPPRDCGGRACPDFSLALREQRLYDDLRLRVQRKRHIFTAHPRSALLRLAQRLRENAIPVEPCCNYESLISCPVSVPAATTLSLRQGFDSPTITIVSESELFGERFNARVRRRTRPLEALLAEARTLVAGEIVVHSDHGIGRFEGLICIEIGGAPHDCVKIAYGGEEILYLPVEGLESISRFGDGGENQPTLDRLGGSGFAMRKARAKRRIKELADKLVATMAARHLQIAPTFRAQQGAWQDFQMGFPYTETDDQSAAIRDVVEDLASGRVMDRIICGDAGFGKTEVALRAAFIVATQGAQVLMLAPTTLLVEQHGRLFKQRFERMPAASAVKIGILSRLQTAQERTKIKKLTEHGEIQILIATHAALAKSIVLPNLALQIIDEEQAFGVEQKERWKKNDAHLLSLSATPIPRSLHMALAGLRDISPILSAPYDRLLVRSFVLDFDAVSIGEALRRERLRGGQAFCVVPRIADLPRTKVLLERLAPEARLVVAHGRLPPATLEQRIHSFIKGDCDLLLSTNIVEAGLDIPRANTMIIIDAQRFGLAQLYQLRGRVGRAKLRGYCYFFIPEYARKQKHAMQRLQLMETLDSTGAGLRVSMQDLDMRGAGNLLGEEQSGKIREIGVELYRKLLREAIAEKKASSKAKNKSNAKTNIKTNIKTQAGDAVSAESLEEIPEETLEENLAPHIAKQVRISLGIPVLIPPHYVAEEGLRMALYRRLAMLENSQARRDFRDELQDRFGTIPQELDNLLALFQIKEWASRANIEALEAGSGGITLRFADSRFAAPEKLLALLQRHASKRLRLGKDQSISWRVRLGNNSARRARAAQRIAQLFAEMAASQQEPQG